MSNLLKAIEVWLQPDKIYLHPLDELLESKITTPIYFKIWLDSFDEKTNVGIGFSASQCPITNFVRSFIPNTYKDTLILTTSCGIVIYSDQSNLLGIIEYNGWLTNFVHKVDDHFFQKLINKREAAEILDLVWKA